MKRASAKTVVLKLQQMYLADDSADDNDDDSFSARNISARQRSSTSPDSKERMPGTLVLATGAGAAPKVNTGNTSTDK
uniref:Uncharacterized protein n=1 Tax=Oryza barthii TaxID=65489 RepID=A0A0D3G004_9ORYZ